MPGGNEARAGEEASGELITLSHNVAGLPQEVSQVAPEEHIPLISPLLNDYDIVLTQEDFDWWQRLYNYDRPHEALGHEPPAMRYRPSPRPFRSVLPPIEYERGDEVRKVQQKGRMSFRGHEYLVSRAFVGEPVAQRTTGDGVWDVYCCHQRVGRIDHNPSSDRAERVTYVSAQL